MAAWADGLVTILDGNMEQLRMKIEAFQALGGAGKPVFVQCVFSYHPDSEESLRAATEQWRNNILSPDQLADLSTPTAFDQAGALVTEVEIKEKIPLFTSISQVMELANEVAGCGADRIILHSVHPDQELFITDFGAFKNSKGFYPTSKHEKE